MTHGEPCPQIPVIGFTYLSDVDLENDHSISLSFRPTKQILNESLSSCYMNRHTVGEGPSPSTSKDRLIEYSHDKQFYLIGGLVRLGDAEPKCQKMIT